MVAPEPAHRIHLSSGEVFPTMNHVYIANHADVYEPSRGLLFLGPRSESR